MNELLQLFADGGKMMDNRDIIPDLPVVVRPIEPELRIVPCRGFIPKPDEEHVDFGSKPAKKTADHQDSRDSERP